MSAILDRITSAGTFVQRAWRCRYVFARLVVASLLLAAAVSQIAPAVARRQFAAIPSFDYFAKANEQFRAECFGEALLIIDAGLADPNAPSRDALESLRSQVILERDSWIKRAKEFGIGALTGQGRSLESLAGALSADMLVLGDVRDILIESSRFVVDGDCDEFILTLSTAGLATTFAPPVDWIPGILKVGRKCQAIGKKLAMELNTIVKRASQLGDFRAVQPIVYDVELLVRKLHPGGFFRVVRHVDDTESLAKLARFCERYPDGAFALYRADAQAIRMVTRGDAAADVLVDAARKDDRGLAWLRKGGDKLLKPHVLLGLAKGIAKGNAWEAVKRVVEFVDQYLWALVAGCFAWVLFEIRTLWRTLTGVAIAGSPPVTTAAAASATAA